MEDKAAQAKKGRLGLRAAAAGIVDQVASFLSLRGLFFFFWSVKWLHVVHSKAFYI